MREFILGALTAAALLIAPASAAEKPPELTGIIQANAPYGEGSLSWLIFTAYDATVWTDAATWSMSTPFALTLRYDIAFTTQEVVDRTMGEMEKVAPNLSADDRARYRAMLTRVFPNVKAYDWITAFHRPGQPVAFFHNGKATGDSGDPAFAEPFFAIWFSQETSEPSLRAKLLRLN